VSWMEAEASCGSGVVCEEIDGSLINLMSIEEGHKQKDFFSESSK
jgi:hypothetical protein